MLADYFREDPLMQMFFEPFIFEEISAKNQRPYGVYEDEVKKSDIIYSWQTAYFRPEILSGMEPEFRRFLT